MNQETYNYWILDPRKPGKYSYEGLNFSFLYEPFYTGISEKTERILQHFLNTEKEKNKLKSNKIKKIQRETNEDPYHVITNDKNLWSFACDLEKSYIKIVGRKDKGLGPLTNLTDGGDGVKGIIYTKEQIENFRQRMVGDKNPNYKGKSNTKDCIEKRKQSLRTKYKNGYISPLRGVPRSEISKHKNRQKHLKNKYRMISPDGKVFEIDSLNQFRKEHDLDKKTLLEMVNGNFYECEGWTGYIIGQENLRKEIEEKHNRGKWKGIDPNGVIFDRIIHLEKFCNEMGLNYKSLLISLKKYDNSYKKWKFFKIEDIE